MIDIRTHNEFVTEAKIHGVGDKLEFKKVFKKIQELSEDSKRMMEQVHRDAIKRKFEERNKKS